MDSVSRQRFEEWFHAILLMEGWRRHFLAFAAGAIGVLALQPIDFLPAFLVSFPLLVWLMDAAYSESGTYLRRMMAAGVIGWWFGFGYFIAGLWWLGVAFVVGGEQFIWLMPLGVIGLPAVLALFPACGAMLARLFWSSGSGRIFALALGLGASEWLRGWLFTGFPWNSVAQSIANHTILAQSLSVIGPDALGIVLIVLFAAPAVILSGTNAAERWLMPALAVAVLLGMAGFGLLRLQAAGGVGLDFATMPVVPNVKLRIVQPNMAQEIKNNPPSGAEVLEGLLQLSDRAKGPHASGIADVTHLIWPESPFPFVLEKTPRALEMISRFLPPNTQVLTGAIRAEPIEGGEKRYRYFNALQVVDKTGVTGSYDKVHLVPFGEYLPFEGLFRRFGFEQFVRVVGGFTAGTARKALNIAGLPPVIPIVCFESIFSSEMDTDIQGDSVIVSVTNDAWFGMTFGPYQHLAQARMRAVEFGRPLVRAANSGISAVFDAYGREVASLPLGVADVLDAPMPVALPKTLYREASWYSFASVMIFCLGLALLGRRGN